MKRILRTLVFVCLFSAGLFGQSAVPVTANINALTGTAVGSGAYFQFTLKSFNGNPARVVGTSWIDTKPIIARPNSSGNIALTLQGNDTITSFALNDTYYLVEVYDGGQRIYGCPMKIVGTSAVNLNTLTCMTLLPPVGTMSPWYVPIAGGTMTGPLYLSTDPVSALGAATKQYVDRVGGSGTGGGTVGPGTQFAFAGFSTTSTVGNAPCSYSGLNVSCTGTLNVAAAIGVGASPSTACGSAGPCIGFAAASGTPDKAKFPYALRFLNSGLVLAALNNVVTVTPDFVWAQTPSGSLTAGALSTVTLTPCPVGIDGRDIYGFIYISGVGTPEPVQLQGGGSCTSGAATGSIRFTPIYSHSAGYTLGTASQGIYEALASVLNWTAGGHSDNYLLVIPPAGNSTSNGNTTPNAYQINGTINIPAYAVKIDARGAQLLCSTRDYCIASLLGGTKGPVTIQGLRIASNINVDGWEITNTQCSANVATITTSTTHGMLVGDVVDVQKTDNNFYWGGSVTWQTRVSAVTSNTVSYPVTSCAAGTGSAATPGHVNILNAAILDTGPVSGMKLDDFSMAISGGNSLQIPGHFNNGVVVLNDQAFTVNLFQTGALKIASGTSTCTAAHPYCGWSIYAPGPSTRNSAIGWIHDFNGNSACSGGDIGWYSGNTVNVDNAVFQSPTETAMVGGTPLGGFGPTVLTNVYNEAGGCSNPETPGGLDAEAGIIQYGRGVTYTGGEGPQGIVPQFATGGGTNYYYYLVPTDSVSGAGPALYFGSANPSGASVSGFFPRVIAVNTLTYTVIRTTDLNNQPTTAACVGGSTSACGSVLTGTTQCAGLFCSFADDVTVATSAVTVNPAPTYCPITPFWPGAAILESGSFIDYRGNNLLGSVINMCGTTTPGAFEATDPTGQSGAWQMALGGTATVLDDTSNNAGGGSLLKGRININRLSGKTVGQQSFETWVDSTPDVTLARKNKRPTMSAADVWVGNDIVNAALNAAGLAFGSPVQISRYINTLPSGLPLERLTASLEHIVPNVQMDGNLTVNGLCLSLTGCGPFSLGGTQVSDNFNRANGSLGGNWTIPGGSWAVSGNQATYVTVDGSGLAPAAYTGSSFSNDHFAEATLAGSGAGSGGAIGVACRLSSVADTGYSVRVSVIGGASTLQKYVAGAGTTLGTGTTYAIGDVIGISCQGTTIRTYRNGLQDLSVTDSAITSGSPGMWGQNTFTIPLALDNFIAGDLTWVSSSSISNPGYTVTGGGLFARLATCTAGIEGTHMPVTDSSTNTWGAVVTGGGANHIDAYCNGSNWTVGAK